MVLPATVDVGDSPRFDVFFPLTSIDEISEEANARLLADGFLTRPARRASDPAPDEEAGGG